MKIVQWLHNFLRALGIKKPDLKSLPPVSGKIEEPVESQIKTLQGDDPEPPDEPPDEFDDPNYDVEHETADDHTEREELPEPEPEIVEKVLQEMRPLSLWEQRQQWLVDLGYDPGPVDGKYGPRTEQAVRAFQRDHNLVVDGIWGPKTQAAIVQALKNGGKPLPPSAVPSPPQVGIADYKDMLGDVELDDDFWACFVDLTHKSNVEDAQGRRRRKGSRPWKNLTRICWHQTAFTWRPQRELAAERKYYGHHRINAHVCLDTDGSILLIHNLFYYLWTANGFNVDCLSFEIMGNFEGVLGTGNWFQPDKFGRSRPARIQLVRSRQFTKWLLDPEQGPADDKLLKPLLEWRLAVRNLGYNPLKWNNAHRQSSTSRGIDCGSECWYHVVLWGITKFPQLTEGPERGGLTILPAWYERPVVPPLG